eukprot:8007523-Karenia_brevis.AAC.1
MCNLDKARWTRRIFEWSPALSLTKHHYRNQGRPRNRWSDDVLLFIKSRGLETSDILQTLQQHSDNWKTWETEYAEDESWRRNSEP